MQELEITVGEKIKADEGGRQYLPIKVNGTPGRVYLPQKLLDKYGRVYIGAKFEDLTEPFALPPDFEQNRNDILFLRGFVADSELTAATFDFRDLVLGE